MDPGKSDLSCFFFRTCEQESSRTPPKSEKYRGFLGEASYCRGWWNNKLHHSWRVGSLKTPSGVGQEYKNSTNHSESRTHNGGFHFMGLPQIEMFLLGKIPSFEMDDGWGYPYGLETPHSWSFDPWFDTFKAIFEWTLAHKMSDHPTPQVGQRAHHSASLHCTWVHYHPIILKPILWPISTGGGSPGWRKHSSGPARRNTSPANIVKPKAPEADWRWSKLV